MKCANFEYLLGSVIHFYVCRLKHPWKSKVVGHYWPLFCMRPWWITYDGTLRFKADLNDYIQNTIFCKAYYEPILVTWLKEHLKPTDIFWDVGANVGAIALIAAKLCKSIYAFEPDPTNRALLEEHVSVNALHNISVMPLALANADGVSQLSLGFATNSGTHSLVKTTIGNGSIQVITHRADTLIETNTIAPPTVMKIDVEGAEWLVLQGAAQLLKSPTLTTIIFETEEGAYSMPAYKQITQCLENNGFLISVLGRSDPEAHDGLNNFIAVREA